MSQQRQPQVVLAPIIRHNGEHQLIQAYRHLWRMLQTNAIRANQEERDGTSSTVCPGFDSKTGTGSDD